jgi:hypothetical protein
MTAEIMSACLCFAVGLSCVLLPRQVGALCCRKMKEIWRMHEGNFFGRMLETGWLTIQQVSKGKVHDEASVYKLVRVFGFVYLIIGFMQFAGALTRQ